MPRRGPETRKSGPVPKNLGESRRERGDGLAFFASLALHYSVSPWTLVPEQSPRVQRYGRRDFDRDLFAERSTRRAAPDKSDVPPTSDPNTQGPGPKKMCEMHAVDEDKDGR